MLTTLAPSHDSPHAAEGMRKKKEKEKQQRTLHKKEFELSLFEHT